MHETKLLLLILLRQDEEVPGADNITKDHVSAYETLCPMLELGLGCEQGICNSVSHIGEDIFLVKLIHVKCDSTLRYTWLDVSTLQDRDVSVFKLEDEQEVVHRESYEHRYSDLPLLAQGALLAVPVECFDSDQIGEQRYLFHFAQKLFFGDWPSHSNQESSIRVSFEVCGDVRDIVHYVCVACGL